MNVFLNNFKHHLKKYIFSPLIHYLNNEHSMKVTMKYNITTTLIVFFTSIVFSQTELSTSNFSKIENLLIAQKLDSAKFYILKQKEIETSNYLKILERIATKTQTYKDFYKVAVHINNRPTNNTTHLLQFVTNIPIPSNKAALNLDYVYTNWLLISKLRNSSKIEEATIKNYTLRLYVEQFNQDDSEVKKANLLLSNHQIILFLIEKNIKDGKALTIVGLEASEELKDNTLQIIFLNHLCDFLVEERDLDGYIKNSELSLSLESSSEEKSPYYIQTLEKLIDAYLFKGGYNKRVNELLETIYLNPSSKAYSYSLYANFLKNIDEKSHITQEIFNKFNVKSYFDFCQSIERLGKDVLDQNQFYFLIDQCSQLLESKGYLPEAIAYKTKCVSLTRKIYSEDLSNSLANYKTEQVVKEKEIAYEKEKTNLYAIIALLTGVVLLFLVAVIFSKNKQEKILRAKNSEIKLQKNAIEKKEKEKGLLLKEVHHRVKNNFQIVASLLELQTKGIEDEKAIELANEGKNRIKSMAIIHQKLYQNDTNLINFDEYIRLLVTELTAMYASDKNIHTSVNSENIMFDVDTAIPLGLIINELITNAYKYAFEGMHTKTLTISINKEDNNQYKLIVSDNGPGLEKPMENRRIKSLGLRLVTRLVKQLQGTLIQTNTNGAYFEIYFKDTNLRKLVD